MSRSNRIPWQSRIRVDLDIDEERLEWYERIKSAEANKRVISNNHSKNSTSCDKGFLRHKVTYRKPARARNHRICHFSRGLSGHRHTCNHDIQTKNPRTLERHNDRNTRSIKRFFTRGKEADTWFKNALTGKLKGNCGQSSVEYALISAAFISIVVGLGLLSNLLSDGVVVSHAIDAASHGIKDIVGGAADVFSF